MSANSKAAEPLDARHRKSTEPPVGEILQISGICESAKFARETEKSLKRRDQQSFSTNVLTSATKPSREKIVTIETTKHPGTPRQQERSPGSCEIESLRR